MLPRTFSKIRCSEVASEAEQILDALLCKPCRAIVATLDLIFGRLCMHLLSQLTSNWENSRW